MMQCFMLLIQFTNVAIFLDVLVYRWSIENSLNENAVSLNNVHPNPTTDDVSFDFYSSQSGNLHIQILDYFGRLVDDEMQAVSNGSSVVNAKMEGLPKGIYSLKVSFDQTGYTSVTKVVKN